MERDGPLERLTRWLTRRIFCAQTRLGWAAMSGQADHIRQIASEGADLDRVSVSKMPTPGDGTALHRAAHGGHAEAVRVLLQLGAYPDSANALGYTPLAAWFSMASRHMRQRRCAPQDLPESFLQAGTALLAAGATWGQRPDLRRYSVMDEPVRIPQLEGYLQARVEHEALGAKTVNARQPSRVQARL